MMKEALQYVFGEAAESARAKTELRKIHVDDGRVQIFHNPQTGQIQEVWNPNPPIVNHADSLQSLVDQVGSYSVSGQTETVRVYVNSGQVVAVLDEKSRREDYIKLALNQHDAMTQLGRLRNQNLDHGELLELLRHDFRDCISEPSDLESKVRTIKFSAQRQSDHDNQLNRVDAVGESVRREVVGAGDLPEVVDLSFAMFPCLSQEINDSSDLVSVQCSFSLDLKPEKFRLRALPGQLDLAKQRGLDAVAGRLRELIAEHDDIGDVPVFIGTPAN